MVNRNHHNNDDGLGIGQIVQSNLRTATPNFISISVRTITVSFLYESDFLNKRQNKFQQLYCFYWHFYYSNYCTSNKFDIIERRSINWQNRKSFSIKTFPQFRLSQRKFLHCTNAKLSDKIIRYCQCCLYRVYFGYNLRTHFVYKSVHQ